MKKLFGTDGIRGVAGEQPLDTATVYAVGLALAHHLTPEKSDAAPRVLIGMDTRESSESIAATLTAGLTAGGAHAESAGVITTPAIAYLTRARGFSAGVVISASHNPWHDNGIKLFGPDGYKLPDSTELAIECEIFRRLSENGQRTTANVAPQSRVPSPQSLTIDDSTRTDYTQFLLAAVPGLSLDGKKIVVDCANGAASAIAPQLFAELYEQPGSNGGEVILTHASPDGRNINASCGALHPEIVAKEVTKHSAALGITFDGDADRALFADHTGRVVNGDAVLLLAARDLAARGLLAASTVVATTMSNMGLEAALRRSAIKMLRAPVGDKYVLEQMLSTGAALGGEQSGHIIFLDDSTTGDGLLTAVKMASLVSIAGKLDTLLHDLKVYPQKIVNVRVRSKPPLDSLPLVASALANAEKNLGRSGRVVVRYSGTERLARVMVEAERAEDVDRFSNSIASALESSVGS